jgi:type II secretory ATPase GspE/PulE/Tfp pilus assembly ATPase PilB-like protein
VSEWNDTNFTLMSEEEKKSIFLKIDPTKIISGDRGKVRTAPGDRRLILIYDDGLTLLDRSNKMNPRVRAIMAAARRAQVEMDPIVEVEAATIIDLYEGQKSGSSVRSENLQLERQRQLHDLLKAGAEAGTSDIHMMIRRNLTEVKMRVHGRLMPLTTFSEEDGKAIAKAAFAVASDLGAGQSELTFQQGALTAKSGILPPNIEMVRMQYSPTSEQRAGIIMRLKPKPKAGQTDIDSLGYHPAQVADISIMRRRTNGLYIFAGKVSSGKTTTLQRTLNRMYQEKRGEISMYSIEEPVELELPGAIQVPVKMNPDGTDGFAEAIKAAMRSDPNVIIMGEIRSEQTAALAMKAVQSGHALWSTVHAGTALGILDRLADFGVETWKLADPTMVRGLVYQRLCGTMCPHCRITYRQAIEEGELDQKLAEDVCGLLGKDLDNLYARGHGCEHCLEGLNGRTVVAETLLTDPELLLLYTQGKRHEMRDYWLNDTDGLGGMTVMHHALMKVAQGILDINEVEEEVDLVEEYLRNYKVLHARLKREVAEQESKS